MKFIQSCVGLLVRGYISTVDTCPFEGRVDPVKVKEIAAKLKEMGCYEISLGDTVGTAVPATVTSLIEEVVKLVDIAHLAVSITFAVVDKLIYRRRSGSCESGFIY